MVVSRRRGFTLIELLVVIAIIGILAAMLFPVFARARESARKIQCLSNVKNIALAIQMYLTDYDKMPPGEHDPEVVSYMTNIQPCCCSSRLAAVNPYLRWPVILDEYIKNRDVWRCPSANIDNSLTINSGYAPGANGSWIREILDNWDACPRPRACTDVFPPGWGGTATDTLVQGNPAGCGNSSNGGFSQQYGNPKDVRDMSTAAMDDPSRYVAVADAGQNLEFDRTSWIAYPDVCRIDSVLCAPNNDKTCGADWENCSWTTSCGPERVDLGGDGKVSSDVQYRKQWAKARHMGGTNIGFADGHAKWYDSEAVLFGGENWSGYGKDDPMLLGVGVCFNPTKTPRP